MQAQQWRKVITLHGQLGEMKTDMERWGLCGDGEGWGVGGCLMCSYILSEAALSGTIRAELFLHCRPSRAVTPVPPQWAALGCGLGLRVTLQISHSTSLSPSLHSAPPHMPAWGRGLSLCILGALDRWSCLRTGDRKAGQANVVENVSLVGSS